MRRSIFDPTPGEGRWPTALLMDGNLGIGGDPVALLARIRSVLTATGRVVVETHADAGTDLRSMVRISRDGVLSGASFPWAEAGVHAVRRHARSAGYRVGEIWSAGGRTFAVLWRGP